jgi:hypothetical protein
LPYTKFRDSSFVDLCGAIRLNQGEIVLLLNDKGIDSTFATGKSQLQWRAFTKYKETGHVFVLSMSRTRGIFIPKRVMSPQQIEELRSLLKAQIPSKVTTSQPN